MVLSLCLLFGFALLAKAEASVASVSVSTIPQTTAEGNETTITVHNSTEALAALLHYLSFSATGSAIIFLLLAKAAVYFRTYALKNSTTEAGLLARGIAHLAADPLPKPADNFLPPPPAPGEQIGKLNTGLNLSKQ